MKKFGPTRGELMFRLWVSIAGLGLLVATLFLRGMPTGPAMFEIIGIAGAFFGGTLIWTAHKLMQEDNSQES